jgi:hypothetical protein
VSVSSARKAPLSYMKEAFGRAATRRPSLFGTTAT